ncbi:acylphosphatase [Magnetospirillum sp. SS-4]|uniref:acylphosphatase n=1 Tax=Magnetospirillum sp. SS-4 TaxID=2681465 RepID=UPI0013817266|nr:acylphosphatase [Magnetospirillum sp. SS-4]CAA7619356.1 Acylphosphatase [Magnetospirillum sp. SS-4]
MSEVKTVRVVIEGRVQGVWYRGWTIEQAAARGLAGWVRNRADGSVEAVFHGPAVTVDDMVAACRHGPTAAAVSRVTIEPSADAVGHGFHQRPTQ